EERGFARQHHGKARRSRKSGQPGQPLLARRDIFILLLVGARYDKTSEVSARQLFAQGRQPRAERNAAFGLIERLKVGFEHGHGTLELRLAARNVTILMKNGVAPQKCKNPLAIMWTERFAVTQRTSNEMAPGKSQESGSTQWRGDTPMPAF